MHTTPLLWALALLVSAGGCSSRGQGQSPRNQRTTEFTAPNGTHAVHIVSNAFLAVGPGEAWLDPDGHGSADWQPIEVDDDSIIGAVPINADTAIIYGFRGFIASLDLRTARLRHLYRARRINLTFGVRRSDGDVIVGSYDSLFRIRGHDVSPLTRERDAQSARHVLSDLLALPGPECSSMYPYVSDRGVTSWVGECGSSIVRASSTGRFEIDRARLGISATESVLFRFSENMVVAWGEDWRRLVLVCGSNVVDYQLPDVVLYASLSTRGRLVVTLNSGRAVEIHSPCPTGSSDSPT